MSGFVKPFDTWASMPHLLPAEDWPEADRPTDDRLLLQRPGATRTSATARPTSSDENRAVRDRAQTFLDRDVATLWPAAVENGALPLVLVVRRHATSAARGPERLDTQYWRANIDPSDLYVQSLPGTDQYRLQPGSTGFTNLAVAGDWTDNGLNAGCVEAATRSGQLAAQAVARSGSQARTRVGGA